MPEALARADNDFVLREGARSAKARRASRPAPKASRLSFLRVLFRGRTILFGGAAALLAGIGVNALFLQSDRHPAPFFKPQERARLEQPAAPAEAAVPVPPSRPAEAAARQQKPVAAPAPVERVQQTAADARASRETIRETQRTVAVQQPRPEAKPEPRADAIAALLRDGRPSAPTPPAAIPNPTADQSRRVLAVQEALKKLGHNLTADGIAGPSTRVAIEQFERSQKMQPSGQMSPRVLRELAARSGVRIP